jgi:hypothetical protein
MSVSAHREDGADPRPPRTANDGIFLAIASVIITLLAASVALISFNR